MADWAPIGIGGGRNDFCGILNLGIIRAHGIQYRADLHRVDAPHAQVAEFLTGAIGVTADVFQIREFGGHVVRGHLAVAQRCAGNFQLGTAYERVIKLARALHGAAGDCAEVARDKIHQTEVQ